MMNNRRRSTRFPLALPAFVRWGKGRDTRTIETQTKDISSTGMYLLLEKQHTPNSSIQFEVRLPDSLGVGNDVVLVGKGRLIRQEPLSNRQIGFGASIERCEIRPGAQTSSGVSQHLRAKAVAQ